MADDDGNSEEPPLDEEAPLEAEGREEDLQGIHELHDPVMREHERPRDGFEPISVWMIMLIMALIGWGGWYLGAYSGAFSPEVTDIIPLHQQVPTDEPVDPEPVDVDPMELGEEMFSDCVACHQADGTGVEGAFPPLVDNERVLERPAEFAGVLLDGLEGPLVVDGVEYDDLMPAHGDWTDEELAAVMTYVRNSWGHDEEPVDETFVADIRELTAGRDEPWTDSELVEFFEDIDPDELGEVDEEDEGEEKNNGQEVEDEEADPDGDNDPADDE